MRTSILALAFLSACNCGAEFVTQRDPPILSVNTDLVDFGEVPVGFAVNRLITLTNLGNAPLDVSALEIEGASFTATTPPFTLEGGASGVVEVVFQPEIAQPYEGVLTIVSNARNASRAEVRLVGVGVENVICGDCNNPPASECLSDTELLVYDRVGTCEDGVCRYAARETFCAERCDPTALRCVGELDDGCAFTERVRISVDDHFSHGSDIVAAGDRFALTWLDMTGPTFPENPWWAGVAMIDADGSFTSTIAFTSGVLAHRPFISTASEDLVAIIGSDLRGNGPNDVYLERIDGSASVVGADVPVSTDPATQFGVRAAFNDVAQEWGVVWGDTRDSTVFNQEVYFQRVAIDGTLVGNNVRVTTSDPVGHKEYPTIAFDGEGYGIVWRDDRNDLNQTYEVWFTRIDASGATLVDQRPLAGFGNVNGVEIGFDGAQFGVVATTFGPDNGDVQFRTVDVDGNASALTTVAGGPAYQTWADLVAGPTGWAVVYQEENLVRLTELDSFGTPDVTRTVSCPSSFGLEPSVAFNGATYGVSWSDDRDDPNREIYFRALTP